MKILRCPRMVASGIWETSVTSTCSLRVLFLHKAMM